MLKPWHQGGSGPVGNDTRARQWLAGQISDAAALQQLRQHAFALGDGTDWSHCDDQQLLDHLQAALASGRLHSEAGAAPALRRLVTSVAAPPPPPPPPPASSPRASPAAAPAPVESTFGSELDVAAMVAVLQQAAQDGVPFCEECERARQAAAAAEALA